MSDVIIIWDSPEDPDGNVQHIAAHHITVDEVEEVLLDRDSEDTISRHQGGRLPSAIPPGDAIWPWYGNTWMITR